MTNILDIVRRHVGRRHKITPREMRDILYSLEAAGLELANGWSGAQPGQDHATAWVAACRDITVISVLDAADPMEPRLSSSNPGSIRYDQPGSMHPMLRATVMFVSPRCVERRDTLDYLRDRADRVLIVRDDD